MSSTSLHKSFPWNHAKNDKKYLLKSDENPKKFELYLFFNLQLNKISPFTYKKPTVIKHHS